MYFVYQKYVNIASECIYSVDDIVEWFRSYIDPSKIIEDYGKDNITAQDIVDDIFFNPDVWYDDFIQKFELEDDAVMNSTSENIAEQIKEVCEDKLIDFYTEYLKEQKRNKRI